MLLCTQYSHNSCTCFLPRSFGLVFGIFAYPCVWSWCLLCTLFDKIAKFALIAQSWVKFGENDNLEESRKLKLSVQFLRRMCNTHSYTCGDVCAVTRLLAYQDDCFHSRLCFNQVLDGFLQVHKHTFIPSSLSHFPPMAKHTQSRHFSILPMWHQTAPVWETTMLPSSATRWPCQRQAASLPRGI